MTENDQAAYFEWQYADTNRRIADHMGGLDFRGKTVLDIGSGLGGRALAWLERGALRVVNVDINRQELRAGRAILDENYSGWSDQIDFLHPDELGDSSIGDLAILFDCFEHLTDPATILKRVYNWLRPGSLVWIGSMGWYNYMASHCMAHISIPWCQVLFSETAILKTIRTLIRSPGYVPNVWERMEGLGRWDGIVTLRDRPGEPLNMLSLRRIRRVLRDSPFELVQFRVLGFGGKTNRLAVLASPLAQVPVLQEVFHSYYTALLAKPERYTRVT
ncbi:MAG: class I SAM-dependent methyltransferase [Isosphaeraceae bacterium]